MMDGTPFEAMTGHAVSIHGLLAEVFLSCKASPRYHLITSYHYPKDVTFGAIGHWLGTRTGASGTATLA